MAVGGGAVRGRGFFGNLLLGGVSVIEIGSRVPSELAADPAPQPAWRRMALLVGLANATTRTFGGSDSASDGLMRRASRYLLLGPLAWRLLALPVPVLAVVSAYGAGRLGPVVPLAALLFGLTVAMMAALLRCADLPEPMVRVVLVADLAFTVTAALLVASWVPDAAHRDVFLGYLAGTVALWTGALGVRGGLVPIVLAVPVQLALARLDGPAAGQGVATSVVGQPVVGRLAWLFMALVITILVLALMGLGTRLALLVGMRTGRRLERDRMLRQVHDTVLQTLEAMALSAGSERAEPALALAELRGMARGEATRLRHALGELSDHRHAGLADELADVAAEIAGLGLRTELVVADIDDRGLATGSRRALRDAVREALRNIVKHAGTAQAVVRVDGVRDGVEVVIRDHGAGFATDGGYGFGITQSILARLREVGGRADIQSWPGRGTRVTMWVPL